MRHCSFQDAGRDLEAPETRVSGASTSHRDVFRDRW